jgi:hypothetical protein
MRPLAATCPAARPRQAVKRLQPARGRRAGHRPRRVPGRPPCPPRPCSGQTPADDLRQPRQPPHPEGHQAAPPGRLGLSRPIPGRPRPRPAWQAAPGPLAQRLAAGRQDRHLPRALRRRWGGARDPPPPVAHRRGHGLLVPADGHRGVPLQPHGRVPAALAPPRARPASCLIPDVQPSLPPIAAQAGGHRRPQGPRVGAPALPVASRGRPPRAPACARWPERLPTRRSRPLCGCPATGRPRGSRAAILPLPCGRAGRGA